MDVAERERLRALRNGHPLTIAYFDIDGLKKVNDRFGHQAGDHLLLSFVAAVVASIRAYDIFARLGGDEFVLILPATDQREALGAVTRIQDHLVGHQPPLSVSVGMVTYSAPTDPLDSLLQTADNLMYQAKRSGGNRLVGNVRSPEPGSPQQVELADLATEPN
jgi:diguanylate cyclase (GGDEF)-like protein